MGGGFFVLRYIRHVHVFSSGWVFVLSFETSLDRPSLLEVRVMGLSFWSWINFLFNVPRVSSASPCSPTASFAPPFFPPAFRGLSNLLGSLADSVLKFGLFFLVPR